MGRNGAGKSTLLKCAVGLLTPQAGEVRINGRATANRPVAEICREAAYLPQNPDDLLYADTVADELTITLRNHDLLHRNGVQRDARPAGPRRLPPPPTRATSPWGSGSASPSAP
jgi:energy-coupling factor transporter ATP-binding protein EcfA2